MRQTILPRIRSSIGCCLVTVLGSAGALAQTGLGDLDGDGRDDVVLRNAEHNRWISYDHDGTRAVLQRIGLTRNPDYRFAGVGDFDGNGADEVLMRHVTRGNWISYAIDGGRAVLTRIRLMTRNLDYGLVGIGDFDGDGADEPLIRHAEDGRWFRYVMEGDRARVTRVGATRNLDYAAAGVGDFDGDGADELLLRHLVTRAWIGYAVDGGRVTLRRYAGTAPGPDYRVVGAGDLDGDDADEVLFRHPRRGSWRLHTLDGQRVVLLEAAGFTSDPLHRPAGVGDLDGDGADEVLLRHAHRHDWSYYRWSGSRASGQPFAGVSVNPDWRTPDLDGEPRPAPPVALGDVGTLEEERSRLFEAVGRDVFAAAYAEFNASIAALAEAVDAYCAAPTSDHTPVESAWRDAMLAWQRAQFVQVGPAHDDPVLRKAWRIQFFPDRGSVERGVRNALAGAEPLTEEVIANQNVGVQGLPALEFLVFSIGGLDDAEAGPRRCELARAIAANLITVAGEVADGWHEDASFLSDFVKAEGAFPGPEDVLVEILTALAQHAETIGDRKLKPAREAGSAEVLESHYAEHSAQNLEANVQAFRALFDSRPDGGYRLGDYLERGHSADDITGQIAERLGTVEQALADYEASLEQIVSGNAAGDTETLYTAFQQLADLGVDAAVAAGVELGFNNQDGD